MRKRQAKKVLQNPSGYTKAQNKKALNRNKQLKKKVLRVLRGLAQIVIRCAAVRNDMMRFEKTALGLKKVVVNAPEGRAANFAEVGRRLQAGLPSLAEYEDAVRRLGAATPGGGRALKKLGVAWEEDK